MNLKDREREGEGITGSSIPSKNQKTQMNQDKIPIAVKETLSPFSYLLKRVEFRLDLVWRKSPQANNILYF